MLAADPASSYSRIALWLTTASEGEMAAYWAGYKNGASTVAVTDLVFLNWTRRNPQAAVAAVAGTGDKRYAWWSWAANDPQAALTAAKSAGREQMTQVACGIGDFNPEWLRTHLDRIPEEIRGEAFGRMRNWPAGQDPLKTLKFMKENGMDSDDGVFKNLVREDPWAALDWWKENADSAGTPFSQGDSMVDLLVATMIEDRPEDLERLAAQTPAGEAKRKMEQALFDRLLETDSAAALEQARAIEVPLVAAQRLGQIGLDLIRTDAAKAFEIAGEILAASPGKLDIENRIDYENSSLWTGSGSEKNATELMNALFAKDRQKTLELIAGQSGTSATLTEYAAKWAVEDLPRFTEWTNQETDPQVQQVAKRAVSNQLARQGSYIEAIEWAQSAEPENARNLNYVLYTWGQADPQAAAAWLENSDLTNEQKSKYAPFFKEANR